MHEYPVHLPLIFLLSYFRSCVEPVDPLPGHHDAEAQPVQGRLLSRRSFPWCLFVLSQLHHVPVRGWRRLGQSLTGEVSQTGMTNKGCLWDHTKMTEENKRMMRKILTWMTGLLKWLKCADVSFQTQTSDVNMLWINQGPKCCNHN